MCVYVLSLCVCVCVPLCVPLCMHIRTKMIPKLPPPPKIVTGLIILTRADYSQVLIKGESAVGPTAAMWAVAE